MRFEIDRLGVDLFSCSSAPPSEVLDDFFLSPGDEAALLTPMLLDDRREGGCGLGEIGGKFGDAAEVRRDEGALRLGVGGAERGVCPSVATDSCLTACDSSDVLRARLDGRASCGPLAGPGVVCSIAYGLLASDGVNVECAFLAKTIVVVVM